MSCSHDRHPRHGLVTDISPWIECFATLAAVLLVCYPDKAPQFMTYMCTIVRASQNFEGPAWATYDMALGIMRQNGNPYIGGSQTQYYTTKLSRVEPRPSLILSTVISDSHASHDCSYAPVDTKQNRTSTTPVAQICRLFNTHGGSQC